MRRRLTWVDVFSDAPLTGNQLAVVHDADGIPDDVQGAFAHETNLSETTFVQRPTQDGADYRNRIWMPRRELPFADDPLPSEAGIYHVDLETGDSRLILSYFDVARFGRPLATMEGAKHKFNHLLFSPTGELLRVWTNVRPPGRATECVPANSPKPAREKCLRSRLPT